MFPDVERFLNLAMVYVYLAYTITFQGSLFRGALQEIAHNKLIDVRFVDDGQGMHGDWAENIVL